MAKKNMNAEISNAVKGSFDLAKFKKSRNYESTNFKPQAWIPVSSAIEDLLSLPGLPHGHITLLRGHSDTGKSTLMLEAAVGCQKKGILPVFLITEMKWSWFHAIQMGLEVDAERDQHGNIISVDGFFIYIDRSQLNSIEDVAHSIASLVDEQTKGNLPYDLCFIWDSIGSIPSQQSIDSKKNRNEWNAGAMSTQFGNYINQLIPLSRKVDSPYTNSLIAVNKVWTDKPESPMGMPRLENKGGKTMWYDASLILTFGNITNSGTSKIKATKNGKYVEFAKITKIQVEKNHLNGVASRGPIVMTPHGFIPNDKKAIDDYKKEHSHEWLNILGSEDFDVVQEEEVQEETNIEKIMEEL